MPITPNNPFKWRHFPGEVILLSVRWYLRYPLAYEHVSELLVERGVAVHPTCIWRWVQTYDLWVHAWRRKQDRGCVIVVRYADDSVVGFEKKTTAQQFLEELRERLGKFGLCLHPDK